VKRKTSIGSVMKTRYHLHFKDWITPIAMAAAKTEPIAQKREREREK